MEMKEVKEMEVKMEQADMQFLINFYKEGKERFSLDDEAIMCCLEPVLKYKGLYATPHQIYLLLNGASK